MEYDPARHIFHAWTGGLHLLADSQPATLTHIRKQVRDTAAQLGLNLHAVSDLEVAAGEVLSNVYRHAYCGVGPVFVDVFHTAKTVEVVISDIGKAREAVTVRRTPPPKASFGGRGLYLVGRLVDDLRIQVNENGHGLVVRMSMRLKGNRAAA